MNLWFQVVRLVPPLFRQVSAILAILAGVEPRRFQCQYNNKKCFRCVNAMGDPKHILFECESLSRVRDYHMRYLLFLMPSPMKESFLDMTNSEKTIFVVSGLNCEFCQEWLYIYIEQWLCLYMRCIGTVNRCILISN